MLLIETQYFPSIAWAATVWPQREVLLEASEHYQKGGLRNRCYIAGPNGPQRLSIPLEKGKHQQTPVKEVRIAYDTDWQRQHWRSIKTAYGSAPFFEHFSDEIQAFFEKKWMYLFDLNMEVLHYVFQKRWQWQGSFSLQNTYVTTAEWQGLDWRNKAAQSPESLPEWLNVRKYSQVFEEKSGFLPNLSVLDLLFCCGKSGAEVLTDALKLPN